MIRPIRLQRCLYSYNINSTSMREITTNIMNFIWYFGPSSNILTDFGNFLYRFDEPKYNFYHAKETHSSEEAKCPT